MNLDPTVSPWIGIFASTGICLWMAAIGAPLSKAVFGDRPRLVWPFYAPALGIVVVLLTTNLSAYVIPGAPSAWFGLIAPSILAVFIAWRTRQISLPSRRASLWAAVLLLAFAGVYLLALANRTQTFQDDDFFHYALTLQLARGVFPPVTPYGVGAGVGYHYGPVLLAASIVNTAAVPAWTATVVLVSFLIAGLSLAGTGYARDKSGSLPLGIFVGAVLVLWQGPLRVGLPPYVEISGQSEGFAWFLEGLAPAGPGAPFAWLHRSQFTLALSIVVLIAASLDLRASSRTASAVAVAAGVSALADASVMIFSSAALGLVGVVRLVWLRGLDRSTLAAALLVSGLLVILAGGPASDAVFGRGGTTSLVRIAFEPEWADFAPFEIVGPALIQVGIVPLLAIGAIAAWKRSSWGLSYLTAAGLFGMVEAVFVQSPIPDNDQRILLMASTIAAFTALAALGSLTESLRGSWRSGATLAVIMFAILPIVVDRATLGVRLASQGFGVGQPLGEGTGYPLVDQTPFRRELFRKDLGENWDFYSWLSRALPNNARLLTTHPAGSAVAAGVSTPTSGLSLQVLSPRVSPVYEDALRFLYRDDLADMQITHLHVTDAWQKSLTSEAQSSLANPDHFKIMADIRSNSGQRHRIFEVVPGAGTSRLEPSSFRALRQSVSSGQPFVILDGLTAFQRQMLLYSFVDHADLRAPPTFVDRATRMPTVNPASDSPINGTIVVSERLDPLMFGLTADDAIWTGYGMRVYDLAMAWSPVWRVGDRFPSTTEQSRRLCEDTPNGRLNLKLLGDPGDEVLLGIQTESLSGKPQVFEISTGTCRTLKLATEANVSPFAQVRALLSEDLSQRVKSDAALAFDGGYDGEAVIINLLYRNIARLPFAASTELRLYEVGPTGVPMSPNPRTSKRWWVGPVVLDSSIQMARVEFDAGRVQVNGESGGGVANEIVVGRTYLLTLNVAVVGTRSGLAEISQQIPLVRFKAHDKSQSSEVFSGIVNLRRPMMTSGLSHEYSSKIGWETDRTPGFESDVVFR